MNLKFILNKLFILTVIFHLSLIGVNVAGLAQSLSDFIENSATLALGAYIAIVRDLSDDDDDDKPAEDPYL